MPEEPLYIPTAHDREMYYDEPDQETQEPEEDEIGELLYELAIVGTSHLEQLRRDIPDSANVLDVRPKRDRSGGYARILERIGPVYREGTDVLTGVSFMYRSPDGGRCGNRVFRGDRDEIIAWANRLLEIAVVEVLE